MNYYNFIQHSSQVSEGCAFTLEANIQLTNGHKRLAEKSMVQSVFVFIMKVLLKAA